MASLLDPRNGPEHDCGSGRAGRCWVLASTPRSASTLLARALWSTGRAGAPKEYLNPTQIRDWEVRLGSRWSRALHGRLVGPAVGLAGRGHWPDARLTDHLRRIRERRTAGGWFGLKIHWHHFQRFFVDPGRSTEPFLGPVRWVWIRREDRLAQAVSWVRAMQTGAWAAHQAARIAPIYDRRAISARLAALDAADAGWRAVLPAETLILETDAVTSDLLAATNQVLTHLGAEPVGGVESALTQQADAVSDAWIDRYRAGH